MPNTYPTITTGMTSGITSISATQDVRTFDFDSYNWTPIQAIINYGRINLLDLPGLIGRGFTQTILKRAEILRKIYFPRKIQGRDF